MPELDVGD